MNAEEKREYMKRWNAENKAWRANYRLHNREKLNAQMRVRRSTPEAKQKASISFKEWRQNNIQRTKDNFARWYSENRAAMLVKMNSRDKKAARLRSREYYQKVKGDPSFQIKNRARAAAGNRVRKTYKSVASTEERRRVQEYIISIRKKRRVKCYYCPTVDSGTKMHIDHVVPLARGGPHSVSNLCVACPDCNRRKNCKMPDEFSWVLRL